MTGLSVRTLCVCFVLGLVHAPEAKACENATVAREMFKGARDVHPLYVVADREDPTGDEIAGRLRAWLEGPGAELNLRVERVFSDDPEIRWQACGLSSRPPELPVVVLAARHSGHIGAKAVDRWRPAPGGEDLAVMLASPVRESIREKAPLHMALLVYSPGTEGKSRSTEKRLQKAVRKWLDRRSAEKPGKKRVGVAILRLDRSDPRERTLVSFTGIPESGPDWVGVFSGPGKMMIPPMTGEQITEKNLFAHLDQLAGKCTCRVDVRGMGVDIPMQWVKGDTARVPSRKSAPGNGRMCKEKPPAAAGPEAAADRCSSKVLPLAVLGVLALAAVVAAGVYLGRKRRGNRNR